MRIRGFSRSLSILPYSARFPEQHCTACRQRNRTIAPAGARHLSARAAPADRLGKRWAQQSVPCRTGIHAGLNKPQGFQATASTSALSEAVQCQLHGSTSYTDKGSMRGAGAENCPIHSRTSALKFHGSLPENGELLECRGAEALKPLSSLNLSNWCLSSTSFSYVLLRLREDKGFNASAPLHSSNSPFSGKEPWNFRAEVRESMDSSLRLRHALIPYLYTMCCRAADTARPLIEPMYWQSPENLEAYSVPHEYRFGTELIAAPIVSQTIRRRSAGIQMSGSRRGNDLDFFDGRRYSAAPETGRCMEVWRGIGRIPVFARAGGIIPMQDMDAGSVHHGAVNPCSMEVLVFPGSDGSFTMREDSGQAGSVPADTALRLVWRSSGGGDGGRNGGTADGR